MRTIRTRIIHIAVCLAVICSIIPSPSAFASGNTLYFTPNSAQINVGGSFTVNVKAYIDTSVQNTTVSGTVTFPKNLLRVSATSVSGSDYSNVSPSPDGNNGTIGFSGSGSSLSGLTQIFSVTFIGTAGGTANLGFSTDSNVNQAATTRNTGSFSVVDPNPPAATTPTPAPTTPTTPTTTAPTPPVVTPTTPTEPTTPTTVADNTTADQTQHITNVIPMGTYNSATVNWKVSSDQTSTDLVFGTSTDTKTVKVTPTKQADGSYTASLVGLSPGVRYYFTITSRDANGKTSTWDSLVVTKGYPVIVAVTETNTAAIGAQVKVGTSTQTTGKDGTTSFELAQGSYSLTITTQDGASQTFTLSVASKTIPTDGSAPDIQRYSYNLDAPAQAGANIPSILGFLAVLAIGGAVLVMGTLGFIAYRRRQFEAGSVATSYANPTVIVDDGYNWQQQTLETPTPSLPPPPMPMGTTHPGAMSDSYEEPKDMFEIAREREASQQQPPTEQPPAPPPSPPVD